MRPLGVLSDTGRQRERKRGRDRRPLDGNADTCKKHSMSKSKPKPTMTDVLKAAIEESGLTRYRIAKDTGIAEHPCRDSCGAKCPFGSTRPTCWPHTWGFGWCRNPTRMPPDLSEPRKLSTVNTRTETVTSRIGMQGSLSNLTRSASTRNLIDRLLDAREAISARRLP